MGLRGPAPTPRELLALRGSWRAGQNPSQPRPPPARPAPPPSLSPEARKVFLRASAHLHAIGVLSLLDQSALARYASLLVDYRGCEEFIAKNGTTYVVRKPQTGQPQGVVVGFKLYPQVRLKLMLCDELLRLEREFGLTPAARTRITATQVVQPGSDKARYFA